MKLWVPVLLLAATSECNKTKSTSVLSLFFDIFKNSYNVDIVIVVRDSAPSLAKNSSLTADSTRLLVQLQNLHIQTLLYTFEASTNSQNELQSLKTLEEGVKPFLFVAFGDSEWFTQLLASLHNAFSRLSLYDVILVTQETVSDNPILQRIKKGAIIDSSSASITLTDIYLGRRGKPQILSQMKPPYSLPRSFIDFEGRQLVVSMLSYYPFVFKNPETNEYDGMDMRLLKMVTKKLELDVTLTSPADGQWAGQVNGTWTGLIGEVANQRTDVAMSDLAVTSTRQEAVDFCIPYLNDGAAFMSPYPRLLPQWMAIIRPFHWNVWLLIILGYFVSSFNLYITSTAAITHAPSPFATVVRSMTLCLKQICSESAQRLPRDIPSQLVISSWILSSMIILAAYSGILTSFLIDPLREKAILYMDDIVVAGEEKNISWGKTYYGDLLENYLNTSDNPIHKALWADFVFPNGLGDCINRTVQGYFVCIDATSAIVPSVYQTNERPGGPHVILGKEEILKFPVSWALQKRSTYLYPFNQVIRRITESGIIDKWYKEIVKMKEYAAADGVQDHVLSLNHLKGPFFFYLLMAGAAITVFLVEILTSKYSR